MVTIPGLNNLNIALHTDKLAVINDNSTLR